jgi:hypothetical protein
MRWWDGPRSEITPMTVGLQDMHMWWAWMAKRRSRYGGLSIWPSAENGRLDGRVWVQRADIATLHRPSESLSRSAMHTASSCKTKHHRLWLVYRNACPASAHRVPAARGANFHDAWVRGVAVWERSAGSEPITSRAGARAVASLSDARAFLGCSCLRNHGYERLPYRPALAIHNRVIARTLEY